MSKEILSKKVSYTTDSGDDTEVKEVDLKKHFELHPERAGKYNLTSDKHMVVSPEQLKPLERMEDQQNSVSKSDELIQFATDIPTEQKKDTANRKAYCKAHPEDVVSFIELCKILFPVDISERSEHGKRFIGTTSDFELFSVKKNTVTHKSQANSSNTNLYTQPKDHSSQDSFVETASITTTHLGDMTDHQNE